MAARRVRSFPTMIHHMDIWTHAMPPSSCPPPPISFVHTYTHRGVWRIKTVYESYNACIMPPPQTEELSLYTRSRARNLVISLLASKVSCVSVLCCIPHVHRSTIMAQSQDTRSFWPPLPPRRMVDVYNGGMDGVSGSRFVSLSLSLSLSLVKSPFGVPLSPQTYYKRRHCT